jgi:hypothetical protein
MEKCMATVGTWQNVPEGVKRQITYFIVRLVTVLLEFRKSCCTPKGTKTSPEVCYQMTS